MKKKPLSQRLDQLKAVRDIATSAGNHDDEYSRGLANGIILAVAVMEAKDPEYLGKEKGPWTGSETS
jgi:hypothetical protein